MKRRNGERNGEIILEYEVDAEKEENKGGRDGKSVWTEQHVEKLQSEVIEMIEIERKAKKIVVKRKKI